MRISRFKAKLSTLRVASKITEPEGTKSKAGQQRKAYEMTVGATAYKGAVSRFRRTQERKEAGRIPVINASDDDGEDVWRKKEKTGRQEEQKKKMIYASR